MNFDIIHDRIGQRDQLGSFEGPGHISFEILAA